MLIKNYSKFTESIAGIKYGCVMVDVPFNNWDEITSMIDVNDLYKPKGIERRPHLTLFYGLHKEVTFDQVKKTIDDFNGEIDIEIDGIDVFENADFDVVKLNIVSNKSLEILNHELSKLPSTVEYTDYKPHITIAFLNKGEGRKYINTDFKLKIENLKDIIFTTADKNKFEFTLDSADKMESVSFINENKMWYKTIPQILEWLEKKSELPWVWLDTETTGLNGPRKEQLTQVSAIITEYDYKTNKFKEIDSFDNKIKLNDETKSKYNNTGDKTKWVLSFNHYGSGDYKYYDERDIVDNFFNFIGKYSPCLMIAQNAKFDMSMLGGRFKHKITNEVFDTKMLLQLYYLPLLQKLSETDDKYKSMIDKIGTSDRDGGLISSSLSKVGPALGVNMTGYHDALTDTKIMSNMFCKIIDVLKSHKNVDISKYQMDRIKILR